MPDSTAKKVTLYDQNGHSQDFNEEHADRLLKYPGSQWSKETPGKAVVKTAAKDDTKEPAAGK